MAPRYTSDPTLRLLPEPPDNFLRLSEAEQRWRGRLWLILYGAGYDEAHAWWLAQTSEKDDATFVENMKVAVERVPEQDYPAIMKARLEHDAEIERQRALNI